MVLINTPLLALPPHVPTTDRIGYYWNFDKKRLIVIQNPQHWRATSLSMKGIGESSLPIFSRYMTVPEQEEYNAAYRLRTWSYEYEIFFKEDEKTMEVDTSAKGYEKVLEYAQKLKQGKPPLKLFND